MIESRPVQLRNLRVWTIVLVALGAVAIVVGLLMTGSYRTAALSGLFLTLGASALGVAIIVGVGAAVLGGVHSMLRRPAEADED